MLESLCVYIQPECAVCNRILTAEGYRQHNGFGHLISKKVRSFRTFSKLLEALQYETAFS